MRFETCSHRGKAEQTKSHEDTYRDQTDEGKDKKQQDSPEAKMKKS